MSVPVDQALVRRALQIATDAVSHGNHPFGALLAHDGLIILEAENTVFTGHDVTNHAEINLVRRAVQRFESAFLSDCILYTSTEPCVMCSGAIYWSGIGAVYGCSAERLAHFAGEHLSVPCREIFAQGTRSVQVIGSVLQAEAEQIHARYWQCKSGYNGE